MRKSILVFGAHYAPEVSGNAPYTSGLAEGLRSRGHDVTVVTQFPHYPEWKCRSDGAWSRDEVRRGVRVRRLRSYVPSVPSMVRRILYEVAFGVRASLVRWPRVDTVLLVSPTLLSCALILARLRVTRRAVPACVWVQDVYSSGVKEAGGSSAASRCLGWIERRVLRSADGVVVIHERFRALVVDQMGVSAARVRTIRNWSHIAPRSESLHRARVREGLGWAPDETVLLHAGNMGAKQALEHVIAAARYAEDRDLPLRFVLAGDGSQRRLLERDAAGLTRFEIRPAFSSEEFPSVLDAADVLLVHERPGLLESAVPSKLTTYFRAGRPVIAAVEGAGITAEEVHRSGGGVVIEAGSPEKLINAAVGLRDDPARSVTLGVAGRRYAEDALTPSSALDAFEGWLDSLRRGSWRLPVAQRDS